MHSKKGVEDYWCLYNVNTFKKDVPLWHNNSNQLTPYWWMLFTNEPTVFGKGRGALFQKINFHEIYPNEMFHGQLQTFVGVGINRILSWSILISQGRIAKIDTRNQLEINFRVFASSGLWVFNAKKRLYLKIPLTFKMTIKVPFSHSLSHNFATRTKRKLFKAFLIYKHQFANFLLVLDSCQCKWNLKRPNFLCQIVL